MTEHLLLPFFNGFACYSLWLLIRLARKKPLKARSMRFDVIVCRLIALIGLCYLSWFLFRQLTVKNARGLFYGSYVLARLYVPLCIATTQLLWSRKLLQKSMVRAIILVLTLMPLQEVLLSVLFLRRRIYLPASWHITLHQWFLELGTGLLYFAVVSGLAFGIITCINRKTNEIPG